MSTGSELKKVTIMFADISGFTAMSEKITPEEVTNLINKCFNIMGSIIKDYDGTIDKYIGDCIMALFGAPVAIEHGPGKAVAAALEIREEISRFNTKEQLPTPIDVHIGINTGEVLAGSIGLDGHQEYTVMGDCVNLASRLEDYADSGQIIVGCETWEQIRDNFSFKKRDSVTVKGKSKPVSIYEVLGRLTKSDPCIDSEMVGRDYELDKLELHLLKLKEGEGSIISIVGEAGIGKSRLIRELKSLHSIKNITLLEGENLSIGKNLSFYPLVMMLKGWADISDDEHESIAYKKLENQLTKYFYKESGEILPFIALFMGLPLPSEYKEQIDRIESSGLENLIFRNIRELFIHISQENPLVLIFEDLHWSDVSTISLLIKLFPLSIEYPVLFINLFRPNYTDTSDTILNAIEERYSTSSLLIQLEPLDTAKADRLIENLLSHGPMDKTLKDRIQEHSEGNPYYIEEVIRFLQEKSASTHIPNTIQEIIISRIDTLDEDTKELLRIASVIGRSFFMSILAEMSHEVPNVSDKIDHLQQIQLIQENRKNEEVGYFFNHALARDAIYNSILLKRRKELHYKTAMVIEKAFKSRLNEFYGVLAYHYELAEDQKKAEEFMTKAGEEALKASASAEAIAYLKKALDIHIQKMPDCRKDTDLGKMEAILAKAYDNKGLYNESVQYYDRAFRRLGILETENKFTFYLTVIRNIILLYKEISSPSKKQKINPGDDLIYKRKLLLDRNFPLFQINPKKCILVPIFRFPELIRYNCSESQVLFNSLCGLVNVFWILGKHTVMKRILDYLKARIEREGSIDGQISLYHYDYAAAIYEVSTGNWQKSYSCDFYKESLKFGDFNVTHYLFHIHILIALYKGEFKNLQTVMRRFRGFINDYSLQGQEIFLKQYTAFAYGKFNRFEEALKCIDSAVEKSEKLNSRTELFASYSFQFWLQTMSRDMAGADQTYCKLKELIQKMDYIVHSNLIIYDVAVIIYHLELLKDLLKSELSDSSNPRNRLKSISEHKRVIRRTIKEALSIGEKWKVGTLETLCLIGRYYRILNKRQKAIKWYLKSIETCQKYNAKLNLANAFREFGAFLSELDANSRNRSMVAQAAKAAIAIYGINTQSIGAEECLKTADTIFAELDRSINLE